MSKIINYLSGIFEKFPEIKIQTWALVIGLIFAAFLLSKLVSKKEAMTTKKLVYGSLCISIAFVLSYIRIFHMPQGGSITPASMLPIMFFAYIFGPVEGIIAGMAYGMLQYVQDAYMVHWIQLLFDYPLAFGALGLAGYFRNNFKLGLIVGSLGRFIFHVLSGVFFFADYAAEAGMAPVPYSLAYNSFIGVELVICIAIASIPQFSSALKRIRGEVAA